MTAPTIALIAALATANQALIVGGIAILRDELVKNLNGTIGSSSAANFDGYPKGIEKAE